MAPDKSLFPLIWDAGIYCNLFWRERERVRESEERRKRTGNKRGELIAVQCIYIKIHNLTISIALMHLLNLDDCLILRL